MSLLRRYRTACEHHAIVPTSTDKLGRCLECAAYVLLPFSLQTTRKAI